MSDTWYGRTTYHVIYDVLSDRQAADHVFNYSHAIINVVKLRESMRGYVAELFADYAASGAPIMRPMFYDFPADPTCASDAVADQYHLSTHLVLYPALLHGRRRRLCLSPAQSLACSV